MNNTDKKSKQTQEQHTTLTPAEMSWRAVDRVLDAANRTTGMAILLARHARGFGFIRKRDDHRHRLPELHWRRQSRSTCAMRSVTGRAIATFRARKSVDALHHAANAERTLSPMIACARRPR